jgi:hypothetical protein
MVILQPGASELQRLDNGSETNLVFEGRLFYEGVSFPKRSYKQIIIALEEEYVQTKVPYLLLDMGFYFTVWHEVRDSVSTEMNGHNPDQVSLNQISPVGSSATEALEGAVENQGLEGAVEGTDGLDSLDDSDDLVDSTLVSMLEYGVRQSEVQASLGFIPQSEDVSLLRSSGREQKEQGREPGSWLVSEQQVSSLSLGGNEESTQMKGVSQPIQGSLPDSSENSFENKLGVGKEIIEAQGERLPPPLGGGAQVTGQFVGLAADVQEELVSLMAGVIGPIAPMILNQLLKQPLTQAQLVDQLAGNLPEAARSRFRIQANQLIQDFGQKSTEDASSSPSDVSSARTAPADVDSLLDSNFVNRCEQQLTILIGPIAAILMRRALAQQPSLSAAQLVEFLALQLSDPETIEAFRRSLFPPP